MAEPTAISSTIDKKSEKLKKDSVAKNGGARPGAGRKPGRYNQKTLVAMKIRDAFNQRVMLHADRLFNAQMNLAVGEQYLFVRITEGEGKNKRVYHEVVTDRELIKQYLDYEEGIGDNDSPNDDSHYYYLSTKPANNMAIDSLLNRALGKVPDKLLIEGGFFNQNKLTIEVVNEREIIEQEGDPVEAEVITAPAEEGPTETEGGPEAEPEAVPSPPAS